MKKFLILFLLIILISFPLSGISCSTQKPTSTKVGETQEGEKEKVEDTSEESQKPQEEKAQTQKQEPEKYRLLYQLSTHSLSSHEIGEEECFYLNFFEYLDGGIIKPDGTDNQLLELKDYPTSLLASKKLNSYYYIYSPDYPVYEKQGFKIFNWDIPNQTIVTSDYENNEGIDLVPFTEARFPGSIAASTGNKNLVYTMTANKEETESSIGILPKFNPFLTDSNLVVKNIETGEEKTLLKDTYNRQLFTSFSDFSDNGEYFYTISTDGNNFNFIRVELSTGDIKDFRQVFEYFDWDQINWNELFPKSDDFSYAYFSLSPDKERLVAYKNYYSTNMDNPCFTESTHNLWLFNLESGKVTKLEKQKGYVSDITWEPNGQKFALAIMTSSGCYPDYLDARIDIFNKNAEFSKNIVSKPTSKITNIEWSPARKQIAYDIYGMDFIGRLNLVNVEDNTIAELINTKEIKVPVDKDNPVLILFVGWVVE